MSVSMRAGSFNLTTFNHWSCAVLKATERATERTELQPIENQDFYPQHMDAH